MVQKIKNFMQHMRTDLPGGHRRYKRSNFAVCPEEGRLHQTVPEMPQQMVNNLNKNKTKN
jgi:hypothetical protein